MMPRRFKACNKTFGNFISYKNERYNFETSHGYFNDLGKQKSITSVMCNRLLTWFHSKCQQLFSNESHKNLSMCDAICFAENVFGTKISFIIKQIFMFLLILMVTQNIRTLQHSVDTITIKHLDEEKNTLNYPKCVIQSITRHNKLKNN